MYVNHPLMVSQMLQNSRIHIFVFNNLYLYSTRYISFQQLIFLFKTIHLHSTSTLATFIQQLIYVQLTFNFNHHYLYSTKIFIQLQPSLFLFNKAKFSDIPTNIHSTNLPVPTPADLQTLPITTRGNPHEDLEPFLKWRRPGRPKPQKLCEEKNYLKLSESVYVVQ